MNGTEHASRMSATTDRPCRRLAKNLSELDVAYRAGWSVDGSGTVERWAPKGQDVLSGLDPALTLVVPEHEGARAAEEATRVRSLPVRVVQRTRLGHAALVRPDGYLAGRTAPEEHPRLLELLARALGPRRGKSVPTATRALVEQGVPREQAHEAPMLLLTRL